MNIVITGATGVLGRRVVRDLVAAGHHVAASPGPFAAGGGRRARRPCHRGRRLRPDLPPAAFAGADTVVNLLTHIPAAERMAAPGPGTRTTGCGARRPRRRPRGTGRRRRASRPGVARLRVHRRGDAWLDEDAPVAAGPDRDGPTAEANATELFAARRWSCASACSSGRTATSRRRTSRPRARGISPSLGRRAAYRPTVWLDDAGRCGRRPRSARRPDLQRGRRRPADARRDRRRARGRRRARQPAPGTGRGPARVRADGALAARLQPAAARGDRVGAARAGRHGRLALVRGARAA